MDWGTIITFITLFGGIETVKWLLNRKTEKRKEAASVKAAELSNEEKRVDWLERRINERDKKVDALYTELRTEQIEKIEWINKYHDMERKYYTAENKKCLKRGCVDRIPPNENMI